MTDDALAAALQPTYRLDTELTGGGMSRVFRASDITLGRDVVIKLLKAGASGVVSAERFAREVQTTARLQQANIVPVLAAGDALGTPYYVMPFVDGLSLRDLLTRGPIASSTAIDLLRDVARALAYAHQHGVVHRDIKPENILLSGGAAVVTDFGIAKALADARVGDAGSDRAATLTDAGISLGTPAYMAPEQALGETVDARSDVYAWGVVAYEVLAGRHPFAHHQGAAALVGAHVQEAPAPLPPSVPHALARVVLQALAKSADARPADGTALLAAVSAAVASPSGGHAGGDGTNAPRAARGRAGIGAVALAAVVSIAGFVGVWRYTHAPVAPTPTIAVLPFENLGDSSEAYFAAGVTDEIAGTLARVPGVQVLGRASTQVPRTDRLTPREVARALGARWVLTGSVQWAKQGSGLARVRILPALVDVETGAQTCCDAIEEPSGDVFRVQADVAARVADGLSVELGTSERAGLYRPETRDAEARDAEVLGRHLLRARGLANIRRAEQEFTRAIARDSTFARAWAGLSDALLLRYVYFDSTATRAALHEAARRASERAVALDARNPAALVARARVLTEADLRLRPALALLDSATRIDPSEFSAWVLRFEVLMGLGNVDEAGRALERAKRLDNLAAIVWHQRMWWYWARGMADSAVASNERALALSPGNRAFLRGMTAAYALAGRAADAKAICEEAFGAPAYCRGWIDVLGGDRAPAPAAAAEARAAGRAFAAFNDRRALPSLTALVEMSLGDTAAALGLLERAVALRDNTLLQVLPHPVLAPLREQRRYVALRDSLGRP
ncbi:MAG: protein kinase [Gemmatimonadaceae bacterium]|nr:protein kinase [Gemmatimonadaceae bacterium]